MPRDSKEPMLVISLGSVVFHYDPIARVISKIKAQLKNIDLNTNHINTIFNFFQTRTNNYTLENENAEIDFQNVLPKELQNNTQINIENILNTMYEAIDREHITAAIDRLQQKYTNIIFVTKSFHRSLEILYTKMHNILPPIQEVIKSSDFNTPQEFLNAIKAQANEFEETHYCGANWLAAICQPHERIDLSEIMSSEKTNTIRT